MALRTLWSKEDYPHVLYPLSRFHFYYKYNPRQSHSKLSYLFYLLNISIEYTQTHHRKCLQEHRQERTVLRDTSDTYLNLIK